MDSFFNIIRGFIKQEIPVIFHTNVHGFISCLACAGNNTDPKGNCQ